jgi:hypothetical protein
MVRMRARSETALNFMSGKTTTPTRALATGLGVGPLAALVALVALAAPAAAQDEPQATAPSTRITVEKDHGRGKATRIVAARELSTEIEVAAPPRTACQATITVSYDQLDTIASVEGAIDNAVCAASHGDYVVAVTIRDASGELKTLEFKEAWKRDDASPVHFKREYTIGENVDLVRIRPRSGRCTCEEALPQSAP